MTSQSPASTTILLLIALPLLASAQLKFSRQNEKIGVVGVSYSTSPVINNVGMHAAFTREGRMSIGMSLTFAPGTATKASSFLLEAAITKPTLGLGLGSTLFGGFQDAWVGPGQVKKFGGPVAGLEVYLTAPSWPVIPFAQIAGTWIKRNGKSETLGSVGVGLDMLIGQPERPYAVVTSGVAAGSAPGPIFIAELAYIIGR